MLNTLLDKKYEDLTDDQQIELLELAAQAGESGDTETYEKIAKMIPASSIIINAAEKSLGQGYFKSRGYNVV